MPKLVRNALNVKQVGALKEPGMYADGGGLYLQVTASGAKTWIYRYVMGTRRREMGLGSLLDVSLAEARDLAADARKLVKEGKDPIEVRRFSRATASAAAASSMTFERCGAAFIAAQEAGWKNAKHAEQWRNTLATYAYPKIGALPVSQIDTGLVLQVIEPIWREKTETASRLRGRIEAVLDWAKVKGYRTGDNPARWAGCLEHALPAKGKVAKVDHHAALPYADMPTFWPKLQVTDGMGARALELAVLTATRSQEVLGARWNEFDLTARVWTIPADRMKAGKEHRVPLSEPAQALLRKMEAIKLVDDGFVFHGLAKGSGLSNMAMSMVLRRMNLSATPHGFRATFRTWVEEETSTDPMVAEAALAHGTGNKLIDAYQRGDLFEKRRRLMDAWAAYVTGSGLATVVPLARSTR